MWEQVRKKWWLALAAVCVIPYFAFQAMHERKALEANAKTYTVDAQVPVKLSAGGTVAYLDGTTLPADAHGLVCFTWADYQKAPERLQLKDFTPLEGHFPVVVFFNASGFDSSGEPVLVRRAGDGRQLWKGVQAPALRHAVPQRDGSFMTYPVQGEPVLVKEADWYRTYMSVEPPLSPAELEKLSDEQLKEIGIQRVVAPEGKTGVRGRVLRVGGNPALVPLKVPVHVFKGEVKPFAKYDPKDDRIALSVHSDANGQFAVPLPPGLYTVVIELEGKLLGNAANPDRWPAVTVKEGAWVEYEFRTR